MSASAATSARLRVGGQLNADTKVAGQGNEEGPVLSRAQAVNWKSKDLGAMHAAAQASEREALLMESRRGGGSHSPGLSPSP